ncbi:N-acetyltransferase [Roseobacter denitrificans]|uniref:Acetyltransferase, GNAT family, putative n=1 Tax=Roseobacter denitrificans (strain ATCC 33942 / OCh 114) TaxID=375451 RepID=Q164F0_ROSDO|nr:GNAT family N-acetyltransferase [Roseobacter denitrificans]ABG32643.1 acetyltransferase, GNAT family, putative [Roseobacter denitrificans OCh 114]AVL52080.1 N-acetyltransferase [Roseobacter denitrificans]SFF93162.1 Acetyltransferase (GNAT) family protein [Roseobacter denitrificans OCh 114]
MSAALTLAAPDHLEKLDALVAAFHQEAGITLAAEARRKGIVPLLEGSPHGAAYLIGPPRAPIGYLVVTFGWSLEFGGLDGFIDEIFVRPGVRGRGIASETLLALPRALASAGLKVLHLEVDRSAEDRHRLYQRAGFKPRENYMLMTKTF